MGLPVQSKLRRYQGMFKCLANWPNYLVSKFFTGSEIYHLECRNGFRIDVPRETISAFKEIFFDETYTRELPDWWWSLKNPVIVDVGANAGYFSLLMASQKPDSTLHAFEPMPANFRILARYQKRYPDMDLHVHQKAISGDELSLVFHYRDTDNYTTTAGVEQITSNDSQTMDVDATPMSAIFDEYRLEKIDFLKLDCEGSEYAILYSLGADLLQKIGFMAIETHQSQTPGHDHDSLVQFLESNGFQVRTEMGRFTGFIWATADFASAPS